MAKYTDEQYLNAEYYSPDEETSHHKMALITTRKEQWCSSLAGGKSHNIPPKTKAIYETAIHTDNGRVSCYLCLECADIWMDEIYQMSGETK